VAHVPLNILQTFNIADDTSGVVTKGQLKNLSKNLLVEKLAYNNANFQTQKAPFRSKIKILSTRDLFCWKFAALCQNCIRNL